MHSAHLQSGTISLSDDRLRSFKTRTFDESLVQRSTIETAIDKKRQFRAQLEMKMKGDERRTDCIEHGQREGLVRHRHSRRFRFRYQRR